MTQKLLKIGREEECDTGDDDEDTNGRVLSISQKLMNYTCSGYQDADAYEAAKPILAHVALYRKTSKNNRAYTKEGVMTSFACRYLNTHLVQDFLTLSEEAYVSLCIRKEIVRDMYDKSPTAFSNKLKKAFVDNEDCAFDGTVEDLIIHAKDGFRTEEINLFIDIKKGSRNSESKKRKHLYRKKFPSFSTPSLPRHNQRTLRKKETFPTSKPN